MVACHRVVLAHASPHEPTTRFPRSRCPQEWDLPDVLRLWDSLLADSARFEFCLYFCVATVLSIREELLENDDFAYTVKALQRFDSRVPMHAVLRRAHALYAEDHPEVTQLAQQPDRRE